MTVVDRIVVWTVVWSPVWTLDSLVPTGTRSSPESPAVATEGVLGVVFSSVVGAVEPLGPRFRSGLDLLVTTAVVLIASLVSCLVVGSIGVVPFVVGTGP